MSLIRIGLLAAVVAALAAAPSDAAMAPLARYRMPASSEIALARSAAPAAISAHATILIFGAHGYRIAAQGSNGFTCLVERAWMQPFTASDFWSVRFRAPVCYNHAAAQSVLRYTIARTTWVLGGARKAALQRRVIAAIAAKRLPAVPAGAMAYMMSKGQYLGPSAKAWYPHVMLFAPRADGVDAGARWGADLSGSPVVFDSAHPTPEPWATFYLPVAHWSDGTLAPRFPAH